MAITPNSFGEHDIENQMVNIIGHQTTGIRIATATAWEAGSTMGPIFPRRKHGLCNCGNLPVYAQASPES